MKQMEKELTQKKEYHSPRLLEYGDIKNLTEGAGNTGAQDNQYGYQVKTSK